MGEVHSNQGRITLFVMPHLPCDHNARNLVTGRVNDGVNERGRRLAPALRDALAHRSENLAALVTSTLPRARETVTLCFPRAACPVVEDDRLTAIDYGKHHGRPVADIRPIRHQFITAPFPGGESYTAMAARYHELLSDLLARYAGRTVLLIGHDATLCMLHHLCEGQPLADALARREFEGRAIIEAFYTEWFGPFHFPTSPG
jgi:probable phosphoglycerate mutase